MQPMLDLTAQAAQLSCGKDMRALHAARRRTRGARIVRPPWAQPHRLNASATSASATTSSACARVSENHCPFLRQCSSCSCPPAMAGCHLRGRDRGVSGVGTPATCAARHLRPTTATGAQAVAPRSGVRSGVGGAQAGGPRGAGGAPESHAAAGVRGVAVVAAGVQARARLARQLRPHNRAGVQRDARLADQHKALVARVRQRRAQQQALRLGLRAVFI